MQLSFWVFLSSFHYVETERDEEVDFRARYFDRVEEAWSRYVELLFPLASVCVFPDIVLVQLFTFAVQDVEVPCILSRLHMAWVSVRCPGNQRQAMHTELSALAG